MKKIILPAALLLSIGFTACDSNSNSATTHDTTVIEKDDTTVIEKEKTVIHEKEVPVEKTVTTVEEPSTSVRIGKEGVNVKSRKTTVILGKDSANLQIKKP